MLVVGPLFQIAAFLVQFLELPFLIIALPFGLGGIGGIFQVGIYIREEPQTIIIVSTKKKKNGFIATFQKDSEYKMGFINAAYGNVILQYVTLTD